MAWSVVSLNRSSGTTAATSQSLGSITAAAGTLVVLFGSMTSASTALGPTVSDSAGNSWHVHTKANSGTTNLICFIAWSVLSTGLSSGSITITRSGSGNITSWCMGAASVTGGSGAEDAGVLASATGTSVSPLATGAAAAQPNDLVLAVTGWAWASSVSYSEDTSDGWTNLYNANSGTAADAALGAAFQTNAGTAGIKYNPALSSSEKWAVLQIALSPAGPIFAQLGIDPSPPKGPTPSVDFLSHLWPVNPDLLGQDAFYGAPGQGPENFDWRLPQGARGLHEGFVAPTPLVLFPAAPSPVAPPDWPLPRGAAWPADLYTWIGTSILESTYQIIVRQLSASGGSYDPNVDPGAINPPMIVEPSTLLTGGVPQLWIAASGGANWGGALVSVSFDGVNYTYVGSITTGAFQGVLTAALPYHGDPDTTDTLKIDLSECVGVLPTSATHADADAFRTLVLVCPQFVTTVPNTGELMAYGAVAATGTYTSNLSYLRRGLYGTTDRGHASGEFFTRIDLGEIDTPPNSVLTYDLPPQYIGAPVYVKLQSFNVFGNATEDIADVIEYSYTPSGSGYGGGAGGVPTTPTGLTADAIVHWIALQWTPNPKSDNVTDYLVLRALSSGGPYSQIGTAVGNAYIDKNVDSGTTYYYEVEAVNAAGDSLPSAYASATAS